MTNIDKFINHVIHNLFPLNEYSEGEMRNLMTKFNCKLSPYCEHNMNEVYLNV